MIKNYFKVAFRNLWRYKGFSLINIMGLAIGMTACYLICLYVNFELSYDAFNSKADRIYRIVADIKTPTEVINGDRPAWAVPPNIKDEFTEVKSVVRIVPEEDLLVRKDDTKYLEGKVLWADSSLFQVFDFDLQRGDPQTVLREPSSMVLSETAARKYFGKSDPVGQTLQVGDEGQLMKVTGIMKDIPENSQIRGEMILSMTTVIKLWNPRLDSAWSNYGAYAYLLLNPGVDAKALEKRFPAFLEKRNGTEMKRSQMYPTLFLEPLKDVYLRSTRDGHKKGNITNVYIFSVVAIFILLIACFNFINLTTARSAERSREVGIRKVVGAERTQLMRQFIGESIIICLIAFFLTVIFSWLLLPLFNELAGKTISSSIFENAAYLLILFFTAIVIGVLAGVYPALVLSAFKPVIVLKGRFSTGTRGMLLRRTLVVSQFTISIGLIIATIIVYNQMSYMRNQDLGFNKDQIMVMNTYGVPARYAFKDAIAGIPAVKSIATSLSVPGGRHSGAYSEIENIKGDLQVANLDLYFVDFDYINQFELKIVAGRPFSREFTTDSSQAMILNEAAVKMFGYASPEQAIGKRFKQWGREGQIIGVMKDFHYHSLQLPIKPLSMRIERGNDHLISVKVSAVNMSATIAAIEKEWKKFIPGRPFGYYFLDEYFDRQYRSEERFGRLFLNFAILAIFISCLGLLGLASYSTIQRTKEIGIRKVMGASVTNIVALLSRDFLRLVAIAALIAFPVAWFAMSRWLDDFAYRTGVSWWVFIASGILAALIALFTISFQAVKAAVANPIKSLRTE
jgi:putative ABC transport system permease protein